MIFNTETLFFFNTEVLFYKVRSHTRGINDAAQRGYALMPRRRPLCKTLVSLAYSHVMIKLCV